MEIKVLTYNIHKGFAAGNRRFVLDQIRELLHREQADIVFLQEVRGQLAHRRRKTIPFPDVPQFEYLAANLWPHYAYGKNAIYRRGHHGNAILSRFPFRFWENIDISFTRLASRSILHGVVEIPGLARPLHTLCVHFGLFKLERRRQLDRLIERIETHVPHDEPLLIAGDFNDWRCEAEEHFEEDLEVRELFAELTGRHTRTFPVWLPLLAMDRIYYRGLEPVSCACLDSGPWRNLSDHAPLIGVCRVPAALAAPPPARGERVAGCRG